MVPVFLQGLFRHLSSAAGCSPLFSKLMKLVPVSTLKTVLVPFFQTMPASDETAFELMLQRLISWLPLTFAHSLGNVIVHLFEVLALSEKLEILVAVTTKCFPVVYRLLKDSVKVNNAVVMENLFIVFRDMFLGYQHTPDLFHSIVSDITTFLATFPAADSGPQRVFLTRFSDLLYMMMHRHSGYPDLYLPLVKELQRLQLAPPAEIQMTQELFNRSWLKQTNMSSAYRTTLTSQGGKIGLKNLGNTCFLNGLLQALFATPDFRAAVLSVPPSSLT